MTTRELRIGLLGTFVGVSLSVASFTFGNGAALQAKVLPPMPSQNIDLSQVSSYARARAVEARRKSAFEEAAAAAAKQESEKTTVIVPCPPQTPEPAHAAAPVDLDAEAKRSCKQYHPASARGVECRNLIRGGFKYKNL